MRICGDMCKSSVEVPDKAVLREHATKVCVVGVLQNRICPSLHEFLTPPGTFPGFIPGSLRRDGTFGEINLLAIDGVQRALDQHIHALPPGTRDHRPMPRPRKTHQIARALSFTPEQILLQALVAEPPMERPVAPAVHNRHGAPEAAFLARHELREAAGRLRCRAQQLDVLRLVPAPEGQVVAVVCDHAVGAAVDVLSREDGSRVAVGGSLGRAERAGEVAFLVREAGHAAGDAEEPEVAHFEHLAGEREGQQEGGDVEERICVSNGLSVRKAERRRAVLVGSPRMRPALDVARVAFSMTRDGCGGLDGVLEGRWVGRWTYVHGVQDDAAFEEEADFSCEPEADDAAPVVRDEDAAVAGLGVLLCDDEAGEGGQHCPVDEDDERRVGRGIATLDVVQVDAVGGLVEAVMEAGQRLCRQVPQFIPSCTEALAISGVFLLLGDGLDEGPFGGGAQHEETKDADAGEGDEDLACKRRNPHLEVSDTSMSRSMFSVWWWGTMSGGWLHMMSLERWRWWSTAGRQFWPQRLTSSGLVRALDRCIAGWASLSTAAIRLAGEMRRGERMRLVRGCLRDMCPREQWTAYLRSISSFEALQAASLADINIARGLGHDALRSLLWKSLLLCHKLDLTTVLAAVRKERAAYDDHRVQLLRPLTSEQDRERFAGSDPLADDESSPWTSLRADEQLRDEIQKDIDRTYPDNAFFRSADVQSTLSNVLFVWSRLHPDVSYRQGMHELAAPIYWVMHADALEASPDVSLDEQGEVMTELLAGEYVEHDTFAIFQKIMLFAKSWYETGHGDDKAAGAVSAGSPIVRKSEYIHEGLLGVVDPELAIHLDRLGVLPQIFLIRWIRLMFGREFSFDETLGLWDGIFVEDPTLQIVDYVCVAMLLRIRWKLLESDYPTALTILLREAPTARPPLTLLKDAIHLRDDLSPATASRLITQHTGRPPTPYDGVYVRAPTPLPQTPASRSPSLSPSLSPRSPGLTAVTSLHLNNIESLMHDVASRMRDRSERWGVNKALREAMGEVKRVSAGVGEQQRDLLKRWTDSMERQTVLGAILEESIKAFERNATADRDAVERVKYVRNCLLDSKTPLDRRWLTEVPDVSAATEPPPPSPPVKVTVVPPLVSPVGAVSKPPPFPTYFSAGGHGEAIVPPDADVAAAILVTAPSPTSPVRSKPPLPPPPTISKTPPAVVTSTQKVASPPPIDPLSTSPLPSPGLGVGEEVKPRRSLAQSDFAWMLGDDTLDRNRGSFIGSPGVTTATTPKTAGEGKKRGSRGDLFGGEDSSGGGLFGP
ncbi:LOW QUALITY PROTEIN: hypothetical protein Dda_6436 [Drechslerella dactyloides]|uniref:Rab-GAP TBC domain-containing protein n=1 Tax=Drechslerella dactyloides TaxID=74499 RepID=A0AAD6IU02_DREDA|nr:LOW QUALITY PROTEIN: hypothetical protein Dda_6436 [Drechslerella dactyloides]